MVDAEAAQALVELTLLGADEDFLRVPTIAARSGLEEADVWAVVEDGHATRRPWRRADLPVFTVRARGVTVRERVSFVWTVLLGCDGA
jgi:hypothetical protein